MTTENEQRFYPNFERLSNFVDHRPEWVKRLSGTLSDRDIARLILSDELKITPLPDLENDLDSCKIDLRLGDRFTRFDYTKFTAIHVSQGVPEEAQIREFVKAGASIVIPPNELIIAVTKEWLELPDYLIGRLEGKSRIARSSLIVEAAPIFDAGWKGYAALELLNPGRVPVVVNEGDKICAMNFQLLSSPAIKARNRGDFGRYRNQTGPNQ